MKCVVGGTDIRARRVASRAGGVDLPSERGGIVALQEMIKQYRKRIKIRMAVSVNGRTAHALWKINGDVLRNRFTVLHLSK